MAQFFYDGQIRRFLLQFARIFSNFDVAFGPNQAGQGPGFDPATDTLIRVPVRYGDASRQAQTILQNNSANDMPATPMMTFYITDLKYDRPRMQEPYFVSNIQVRQRTYDETTDTYETTQGNAFTIERAMPVPFEMTINLDIWTSNTNQKMQLLEQILTLFNPGLEIQSTDNYIDWTSLTVLYLKDSRWSSRTIPVNADNSIDVSTLTFTLPMFITPPAKVKKLGVVERVIMSVFDGAGDLSDAVLNNDLLLGTRQVITPYNYAVVVIGNQVQVLKQRDVGTPPSNDSLDPTELVSNSPLLWTAVIPVYGELRPGVSQLRLEQPDQSEVIGTIVINPNDDRLLLLDLDTDTVPANTLEPIDAIIDPLISAPGDGLDSSLEGQRYLLTEATGAAENLAPAVAWVGANGRPLIAAANDIVEYRGGYWRVAFAATTVTVDQYVTNITTGIQYRWTGEGWIKSYQGLYLAGTWRLVL